MKKLHASDIVLKALGLLLLTAAVLKGHELLTVPVANRDLWSWRPFLIFQVEFELALGIWLLSGIFKRLAWLAALACFGLFCCVTLYRGLIGAASCGCFGTVHVNPWITLLAIDLPAVVALMLFRPRLVLVPLVSVVRRQKSIDSVVAELTGPLPPFAQSIVAAMLGVVALGATAPALVLAEPPKITAEYELLEPETWVGRELPILRHIDIGTQLRQGNWLVVLYHHNCPSCARTFRRMEQMVRDSDGRGALPRVALIEVPPYGPDRVSSCTLGRLTDAKKWFVVTPATVLTYEGRVRAAWERDAPDRQTVVALISNSAEEAAAAHNTGYSDAITRFVGDPVDTWSVTAG